MVAQSSNLSSSVSQSPSRSIQWPIWVGSGLVAVASTGMLHPHGLTGWAITSAIAGGTLWYGSRLWTKLTGTLNQAGSIPLTRASVKKICQQTEQMLIQLAQEWTDAAPFVATVQTQLALILQGLTRQMLTLAIVGDKAVGKTTLKERLAQQQDWPQWNLSTIHEISLAELQSFEAGHSNAIATSDVVLFVIQGDLSQSEWNGIETLRNLQKRVFLLINKQDQYLPAQLERIKTQVKTNVKSLIAPEKIVAIATSPTPITVRRHQSNGSYIDSLESQVPQLDTLFTQLQSLDAQAVSQLVLQQSLQQAQILQQTVRDRLNEVRRDRAVPLVERYQWIAAGTTFANPLPSLDMVATAVITGKLVQELSALYDVRLSVQNAQDIAAVMVKTLIQMGSVEVTTQLLAQVLKTNLATFVAGGLVQGVGAAYFTRVAGYTLIECFEQQPFEEKRFPLDGAKVTQAIQRVLQQHQRLDLLKDLAMQAKQRLFPEGAVIA